MIVFINIPKTHLHKNNKSFFAFVFHPILVNFPTKLAFIINYPFLFAFPSGFSLSMQEFFVDGFSPFSILMDFLPFSIFYFCVIFPWWLIFMCEREICY